MLRVRLGFSCIYLNPNTYGLGFSCIYLITPVVMDLAHLTPLYNIYQSWIRVRGFTHSNLVPQLGLGLSSFLSLPPTPQPPADPATTSSLLPCGTDNATHSHTHSPRRPAASQASTPPRATASSPRSPTTTRSSRPTHAGTSTPAATAATRRPWLHRLLHCAQQGHHRPSSLRHRVPPSSHGRRFLGGPRRRPLLCLVLAALSL